MDFHLNDLMNDLYLTHRIVNEAILHPHDALRVSCVPNYLELLLEYIDKLRSVRLIPCHSSWQTWGFDIKNIIIGFLILFI